MKKLTVLVISLFLALNAWSQGKVVVIGQLEGVKDGVTFTLMGTDGNGGSMFFHKDAREDNGVVKDGKFILEYRFKHPFRQFRLFSSSEGFYNNDLIFWANSNDTVYIQGKGYLPGTWKVRSSAPEQKELDKIQEFTQAECAAYQQAVSDLQNFKTGRNGKQMSDEEWDASDKRLKELETLRDEAKIQWYKKKLEALKELPVTNFWMDCLLDIVDFGNFHREAIFDKVKEVYELKSKDIDKHPNGKSVALWLYPIAKAEIGKECVDIDLYDVNGKIYRLKDFRGKYVLLDFWANWCGWCIGDFPAIKAFQEKHKDNLTVISLSVDKLSTWKNSSHQKEITWVSLNDGSCSEGMAKIYNIKAYPTYILISPEGIFLKKMRGSMAFEKLDLKQ